MKYKINSLVVLLFLASCNTPCITSNRDHVSKFEKSSVEKYSKEDLKEYTKEDLTNNTILFETTREECRLGIRKTPGETCGNVTKVIIDIYKKQANIYK